MMRWVPVWLRAVLLLVMAAGLQGAWGSALSIYGASPDLLLVTLTALALVLPPAGAAAVGLLGGWFTGALVGRSVGSFIVTRLLLGAGLGLLELRFYRANPLISAGAALLGTLFSEGVFFVFSPEQFANDIPRWGWLTLGKAGYHIILIVPLSALVRRIIGVPDSSGGV